MENHLLIERSGGSCEEAKSGEEMGGGTEGASSRRCRDADRSRQSSLRCLTRQPGLPAHSPESERGRYKCTEALSRSHPRQFKIVRGDAKLDLAEA
jgi:hypothetical protein